MPKLILIWFRLFGDKLSANYLLILIRLWGLFQISEMIIE